MNLEVIAQMGPKRRLSRERILAKALELVDKDGVDALSMRALGDALEVSAMSLYRYVPSKADLVDAIQEAVLSEMRLPKLKGPWPDAVKALARTFRTTLAQHPRSVPVFARPTGSKVALELVSELIALLESQGVDTVRAFWVYQTVLAFVVGHAMWQFSPEGPTNVDEEFEFGLDALISGLERKLDTPL